MPVAEINGHVMHDEVHGDGTPTHRYIDRASSPAFWRKVDVEHRTVLTAVVAGDADGAHAAMAAHLGDLGDLYVGFESET